jgi:pilus assembly protein CpaB
MPIRTIATLAIAIVLGLVAVVILNGVFNGGRKTQQLAVSGVSPVVVAALPIARGATLQPTLLKIANYPQDSVPAGAFTSIAALTGAQGAQRLAMRSLTPGEPILLTEVSGPGGRLNLSSVLDPGKQAVAIRSGDVAGVGGFVLPGDRVDVLLTRVIQGNDAPPNTVTQILAENIRVVGIDQSDNDEASKPSVAKAVTIEVTPEQAQTIALGQSVGAVSLSLRHVADVAPLARHATTVAELGFVPPAKRPPANASASAANGKPAGVPLYGPGIVRVTRVTETTGYRLGGR